MGWVLVHNHVGNPPHSRIGEQGFRAWWQPPTDRLVVCDCGWAPLVAMHYRIAL